MPQAFDHLVRLDGSHKIGLGHVYRSRELALKLQKQGQKTIFLINNNKSVRNLTKGFTTEVLSDEYSGQEVILKTREIIKKFKVKVIISDLLFYPDYYKNFLKTLNAHTVTFHEHLTKDNFSEVIINYNTFKDSLINTESNSNDCLGPKFCLLPEKIKTYEAIKIKRNVEKILLTFGGSDPQNYSIKVIRILNNLGKLSRNLKEIILHLGPENNETNKIKSLIKSSPLSIRLVEGVEDFPRLMKEADLAICSGGNTMYELCYLGIPSIVLPQNLHQENFSKELFDNQYLKMIKVDSVDFDDTLRRNLFELMNDLKLRKEYHSKSIKLFDGLGLDRITDRILNLL